MLASFTNFAIISSVHPALVYFTVILAGIAFIFQSTYYFGRTHYVENNWMNEVMVVGRWCLWLALFFSILAVLTGLYTYYTVPHDESIHLVMSAHRIAAIISFGLIIITGIFSIVQFYKRHDTTFTLIILLTITQVSVLITAYLGNEIVKRYSYYKDMPSSSGMLNKDAKSITKVPLYWIDPMEPTVHYPKGGTSPMGMELEPIYPKDGNETLPANTIKLPSSYIDNLGVKTTLVKSGASEDSFSAYASVESNETKIAYITSYANGWVRNLVARTLQMPVKQGKLLAQIYSPTIINAENEYQSALISKNDAIIVAAKNKLLALHVDPIQINAITPTAPVSQLINIYASQNGVITSLNIRDGDYITPDKQLFAITDLSSVWMIANVFEKQANQVKVGMPVKVTINSIVGRIWAGKVDYVYPQLDDATRTLRIRVVLDNSDFSLKPSMYGNVQFNNHNKSSVLLIPTQALIMSSTGNRVIVALGDGMFQVRQVTIGHEVGEMTQITSGLSGGEQVVTNGEFMLDSEASLSAGISRIDSSASKATASAAKSESKMDDMDMSNMKMDNGN